MDSRQTPLMRVVQGEPGRDDNEAAWLEMWRGIAEACEAGLTGLPPTHPRRPEALALLRDARAAARLPDVPLLRSA